MCRGSTLGAGQMCLGRSKDATVAVRKGRTSLSRNFAVMQEWVRGVPSKGEISRERIYFSGGINKINLMEPGKFSREMKWVGRRTGKGGPE